MKKLLCLLSVLLLAASCNKSDLLPWAKNSTAPNDDTVLINKSGDSKNYFFNISTKHLTLAQQKPEPSQFTGLPEEKETGAMYVENSPRLTSRDKSKIIILSTTYDKTQEPSDFSGEHPIISEKYYLCDSSSYECSPTDILTQANNKLPSLRGCWFQWDSDKNWFFGTPCGEGGGGNYIAKYDATRKIIQKVGNEQADQGKETLTFGGSFSPLLQKFFITSEDTKTKKVSLLIYDTSDFSKPIKTFDSTSLFTTKAVEETNYFNGWHGIWTKDESTIYLVTDHNVYSINTTTGNTSIIANDTKLIISNAVLSSAERYLVYTDPYHNKGINQTMKAIDLQDNNKILELLSDNYITLIHEY